MSEDEIMIRLRDNPDAACWLDFKTCQVRLGRGEGLVLLRCLRASREPGDCYCGPTQVKAMGPGEAIVFMYPLE